jgi:Protein of unknown function (DUF4229)
MRAFIVYNAARLGLFLVALGLLHLFGLGGLMMWALALVISGIASYVVLSSLRDKVSVSVTHRVERAGARATNFKQRLEEGATVEDEDASAASTATAAASAESS